MAEHRVVIVGGGFAGLYAAKALGREPRVEVTLVDRRNFHLFQPLLYQVATGALTAGEIAQPLRAVLRGSRNVRVVLGQASGLDLAGRRLLLSDGGALAYDTLLVATGARHSYFGHDAWAPLAPGLKTVEDALEMRRRIFVAFEAAEREDDAARRRAWMTFVVVGGGPTGVELAGALAEIARDVLKRDFRLIDPGSATILLVEGLDRILPTYRPSLSRAAARQLERLGATVRTGTLVTDVDEEGVTVRSGERSERIATRTVLWAAGVTVASFGRVLAEAAGASTDRAGRIPVEADLTLPGHPEIFVAGDLAAIAWRGGRLVPGTAQPAIQEGRHVARAIRARLDGRQTPTFRYRHRGDLATVGRLAGVADLPWLGPLGRFSGFPAWALWLGIHIVYLIGFPNRLVVLVRWAWSFITRGRNSRLITGEPLLPPLEEPHETA